MGKSEFGHLSAAFKVIKSGSYEVKMFERVLMSKFESSEQAQNDLG
jgi:hypothetical protein